MTNTPFSELGLAEPILRALKAENYETPTPIQAQAIPALLAGKDLLGIAQTGTGKTAAFSLPILNALGTNRVPMAPKSPRALILAPTRELAVQIGDALRAYGRFLGLRHTVIVGGVGFYPQMQALSRGVDILVATPGRLLDHMQQNNVRFDRLTHLVLDEADRMLDMGFVRDVRRIVAALPKRRQSAFFSATMPPEVARLAGEMLNQPARVEVTPEVVTVDRIDQRVHFVNAADKRGLLVKLLGDAALQRVIVFTRTKHGANKVAEVLAKASVPSDAIHGNKSQNARQKALDGFRSGRVRVLVATDIAARGIDVDGVTHVVNYELPNVPETYVHRIGRTARAGADGIAISFCDGSERAYLRDIERLTKRPIAVVGGTPPQGPQRNGHAPSRGASHGHGRPSHHGNGHHGNGHHRGDRDHRGEGHNENGRNGHQHQRDGQARDGQKRDWKNGDFRDRDGQSHNGQHRAAAHRDGHHHEGPRREGESRPGQHRDGQHRDGQHRDGQHRDGQHRGGHHRDGRPNRFDANRNGGKPWQRRRAGHPAA